MNVILTVPHGCPSNLGNLRLCDLMAETTAKELHKSLNARNVSTQLFINKIPRQILDHNRIESRQTDWRRQITKAIQTTKQPIVLDIHSFPNHTESFGATSTGRPPKMVIFDNTITEPTIVGSDIKSVPEDLNNDIVVRARELGAQARLIEFNEDLRAADLPPLFDYIFNTLRLRTNSHNQKTNSLKFIISYIIIVTMILVILYVFNRYSQFLVCPVAFVPNIV